MNFNTKINILTGKALKAYHYNDKDTYNDLMSIISTVSTYYYRENKHRKAHKMINELIS